jgi:membrane protease YdiL (CAAX protease family)
MLDRRATRIVWAFLIGASVTEGWAIYASFNPHGNLLAALLHYTITPIGTPLSWVLAALVTALYAGYAAYGSATIRTHMLRPSTWRPYILLRIAALVMTLICSFFEEAFFRKFLMDWVMHHGEAIAAQIAISAIAFGFVHAIWGIAGGNFRAAFGAMTATGVLGAALAVVYVIGGRSVAPCVVAHTAINLLIEPWLIMTAATNGWRLSQPKAPASS